MKSIISTIALLAALYVNAQEAPKVLKTEFSKEALAQKLTALNGKTTTVKEVLKQHKGKVVVLDLWASWCRDCIKAMPKVHELEHNNPKVDFILFSLDRSNEAWKKGIEKYHLSDKEHYWFSEGWKNDFNNYIDLNWIPRYLVINQKSGIAKYYAISPEDPDIQKTIDGLVK